MTDRPKQRPRRRTRARIRRQRELAAAQHALRQLEALRAAALPASEAMERIRLAFLQVNRALRHSNHRVREHFHNGALNTHRPTWAAQRLAHGQSVERAPTVLAEHTQPGIRRRTA